LLGAARPRHLKRLDFQDYDPSIALAMALLHDPNKIRNVAIIAHVDHGKTSLVDRLLRETRVFRENQSVNECVMDRHDIERERGITIFSKACAVEWKGVRINIIDTPGHSDFGGEVERVVRMADAALILVCAADGPMPQTRFVLRKALAQGLKLVVVVNKCDRKDARPHDAADELLSLLIDLEAPEDVLDSPVIYASAREGKAAKTLEAFHDAQDVSVLLDTIVERVPPPRVDFTAPLQMPVSQIEWDDYLGRITVGKIMRGTLRAGQPFLLAKTDGRDVRADLGDKPARHGNTEVFGQGEIGVDLNVDRLRRRDIRYGRHTEQLRA
jgi:GTP-binding protein